MTAPLVPAVVAAPFLRPGLPDQAVIDGWARGAAHDGVPGAELSIMG